MKSVLIFLKSVPKCTGNLSGSCIKIKETHVHINSRCHYQKLKICRHLAFKIKNQKQREVATLLLMKRNDFALKVKIKEDYEKKKERFFYLTTHLWQHHLTANAAYNVKQPLSSKTDSLGLQEFQAGTLEKCGIYRTDVRLNSRGGKGGSGTGVKQGVNEPSFAERSIRRWAHKERHYY